MPLGPRPTDCQQALTAPPRWLSVTPEEWPVVTALTRLSALVVGTNVIGMTTAVSLFLLRLGVERLPWMYPLAALAVLLVSFVYLTAVDRTPRWTLVSRSFALFALAPTVCWLCLGANTAVVAVFMLAYLSSQYSTMQFWLVTSDLIDPRAAKRLYGIINGGGSAGALVMGLLAHPLASGLHTENLLLVWSALMAACWFLLRALFHRHAAFFSHLHADTSDTLRPWQQDLDAVRRIPLAAPAALIQALVMLVSIFIDYQYNHSIHVRFHSEEAVTSFLGAVYGFESVVAIVLQLTVVARVVSSLGVVGTLLLQPFLLAVPCLWMGWAPGLWAATACRLSDHVLQYTLFGTAGNSLFASVPARLRGRLVVFLRLLASPLAVVLAGLTLLATRTQALVPLILAGLGLWVAATLLLRRGYLQTLVDNLAARDDAERLASLKELTRHPEVAVAPLRTLLGGQDEGLQMLALDLLTPLHLDTLGPEVESLLVHPATDVRRAALRALVRLGPVPFRRLLDDPDPWMRRRAIDAAARAGWNGLPAWLDDHLAEENDAAVVRTMLAHRQPVPETWRRYLLQALRSDRRAWALEALFEVADAVLEDALAEEAGDAQVLVCLRPDTRWLERYLAVLRTTSDAALVERVAHCLRALGGPAAEAILAAFAHHQDTETRRRLLQAITGSAGLAVLGRLLPLVADCPSELEPHLLEAVASWTPAVVTGPLRDVLERWVSRSAEHAVDEALTLAALADAPDPVAVELLADEACRRLRMHRHRVFEKLRLLIDEAHLHTVRRHLEGAEDEELGERERHVAGELFENLLPTPLRHPVMALVDRPAWGDLAAWGRAEGRQAPAWPGVVAAAMTQEADPFLQACGIFAAARLGLDVPAALRASQHPVVAETVSRAARMEGA